MVSFNDQHRVRKVVSHGPMDFRDLLEVEEKAKLRVAAKFGKYPVPKSPADVAVLLDWSRRARVGECFVDLILHGMLLAVALQEDDEVACSPSEIALKPRELEKYQKRIRRIRMTLHTCDECRIEQAVKNDDRYLITEQEEKRLRFATKTAMKHFDGQATGVENVLRWAKQCRREAGQLGGVLAGQLLPVVHVTGKVAFRPCQELPRDVRVDFARRFHVA